MSSGSKGGRSSKASKGVVNKNAGGGSSHTEQSKSDHNHNEKENVPNKIAPTAEQMRIAQMIDTNHSDQDKVLHEKINQVMLVASVTSDDAIVALHDCDNNVNAAIDSLIEGDDQGEWRESNTKKKKKAPATKVQTSKEDSDSNKENRRVDSRERSNSRRGSGPPRFRGRGGGRNKDDSEGGVGRGSSSRRRGMANGTAPVSRGRGARGRGSSSMNSRTFQKRQPPGFTETIDTWGAPSPEKVDNSSNNLQIDNWDEETSGTTEDWDAEWTGSLDKTTVFGPSSSGEPPVKHGNKPLMTEVKDSPPSPTPPPPPASVPEPVNVLSLGQNQSINQSIDLAALLQKAAPHSTLGRLPPTIVDSSSSMTNSGSDTKSNILGGIQAPPLDSRGSVPVSLSGSQSYSAASSAAINNSMFSNSVSNLGSSLTSGTGVSKVLGLSSQSTSLASRSKTQSRRLPQGSSKIPSSAVEMPEVAMAALDMQFTGLEFGTETFDFTSDVKPVMGNSMVSGPPSSVAVSKDLSSLNSSLSQPQTLGPQPIPFPSQANERKSLLASTQRPTGTVGSNAGSSMVDLSKKENLGSLVGSSSSYQSSTGGGYKPTSSFPSPPSAHYSQNQNYSSNSSSGVVNSSYVGSSTINNSTSNNNNSNAGSGNAQSSGGYGSSFSASGGNGQYQNNYVNASSHSLASINVPKTMSGLKESTQSYNDSANASVNLSGSMSTNASAGGSNNVTGGGLSSSSLNSASSSVQSTKSSVPGKSVNSLGNNVPPGVQQHSSSQSQQQHQVNQQQSMQQHQHHLQQQQVAQSQQTQLMAGPSQYVSPQAALQGAMPPPFYNVQQPAMYSYEDLQMFQQRIPHMTAPTTMTGVREGSMNTPSSYSVADAAKFRTDQNSSPVPSTINQQATAAGTYITATQNAGLPPPFYMYQTMPPVPSNFTQYGTPAIIQIPPNSHTGSSNTQFPGPPKLPYGGSSTYYDSMSQTQDYKTGYGSGSQGQSKSGPNSTGSASNSVSDISSFKNHLAKATRSYDKQGFHTGNPQAFNLAAGSGTNPMTASYTPMFIPTMPTAAQHHSQHHSQLMHHQLHQDGSSSSSQRTGSGVTQNKGVSKPNYGGSFWAN